GEPDGWRGGRRRHTAADRGGGQGGGDGRDPVRPVPDRPRGAGVRPGQPGRAEGALPDRDAPPRPRDVQEAAAGAADRQGRGAQGPRDELAGRVGVRAEAVLPAVRDRGPEGGHAGLPGEAVGAVPGEVTSSRTGWTQAVSFWLRKRSKSSGSTQPRQIRRYRKPTK